MHLARRASPPDVGSVARNDRYRRAAVTAGAAFVARGISLSVTLLTVPLTLSYLGPARFGVWVTITSVAALATFFDLGLGNGLLNAVTRSLTGGSPDRARREVASAFWMLVVIGLGSLAAYAVSTRFVSWSMIVAAGGVAPSAEVESALGVILGCYFVGLPLGTAAQIRFARQEGWTVHLAATLGNVVAVAALLLVISVRGDLPTLALAMGLPTLVAAAGHALVVFVRVAPDLRPRVRAFDRGTAIRLLRAGGQFFVIQLAIIVAFNSDAVIVAQLVGPRGVAEYGVVARLFAIPIGLVALGLAPLWPAYGEAAARGDEVWIRRTLRATTMWAIVGGGIGAIGIVIAARPLIALWVGGEVDPAFALILGFGVWVVLNAAGTSVAMFLNGLGNIRLQALSAVAMAGTNVLLSVALTARFGVAGVIWGTVLSYGGLTILPMVVYVRRILRHLPVGDRVRTEAAG